MKREYPDHERVVNMLREIGAIVTDSHIVYTSGLHGSTYVNKDVLLSRPDQATFLCEMIAAQCPAPADVVIGPAIAGAIFAFGVARHMSYLSQRDVRCGYAEKDLATNLFMLRRGYDDLVKRKTVLVVEDVLNTGGSARGTVDAVRAAGGTVIGVAAICNRGGVTPEMIGAADVPVFFSLVEINLDAWDEAECPMCGTGVPIDTSVGHGKQFLASRQS